MELIHNILMDNKNYQQYIVDFVNNIFERKNIVDKILKLLIENEDIIFTKQI